MTGVPQEDIVTSLEPRDGMAPSELFQRTLFRSATLPWKTVHLDPTALEDYAGRPLSQRVAVAELYHQNSKLYPQHPALAQPPARSPQETRRDFVLRRTHAAGQDPVAAPDGAARLLELVRRAAAQGPETLYGIDLRLVVGQRLFACEPCSAQLRPIRDLEGDKLRRLYAALAPGEPRLPPPRSRAVLALVGSFARNEILLGSRGYRRTVLDAGRFLGALEAAAHGERTLTLEPLLEFYDRVIDRILEVDGTEQGTLALVLAGERDGSR